MFTGDAAIRTACTQYCPCSENSYQEHSITISGGKFPLSKIVIITVHQTVLCEPVQ